MTKSVSGSNKNQEKKQNIFRRLWEGWKKIARKIGDFNARVILTIFYLILLCPFALLMKLFTDPLEIKNKEHVGWHDKEKNKELSALENATRQS